MNLDTRQRSLVRWSRWVQAHRRLVIVGWPATVLLAMAAAHSASTRYANNLSLPRTDSQRATDLSLATAVFLDAFVVRSLLLPSVLAVLGERTWKLPRTLERWIPHIAGEAPASQRAAVARAGRPLVPTAEEPARRNGPDVLVAAK